VTAQPNRPASFSASDRLGRVLGRLKRLRRGAKVTDTTPRRLHIGCGDIHIDGWCNVDIDPVTAADVIDDITTLDKFPDAFAETIYACHVLEHVAHDDVAGVLATWYRVLAPGGALYVSVPDIDRIVRIYTANWEHFQTRPNTPWIGLIYGGQLDKYDFHRTGFNFCWMTELLERAGFTDVQEYAHEPHPFGVADASLANEPFGEFVSLNVRAVRV
jgi:predicted SAM-dependent methyltransferase